MSHNSPLECPICYMPYNFTDKIPLLCPCGHSLCQFCIGNLIKNPVLSLDCPICKHKKNHFKFLQPSDFPKNFELIKMMEKIGNSDATETKCCPDHVSPFEYICLSCKTEICAKCLSYNHRNHEFELLGDFYPDVEYKAMLVKREVDKVESYLDRIDQEFINSENKLYENISSCFEAWTNKLVAKENDIKTQVNSVFNGKRRHALFANDPDALLINWAKKFKPIVESYEKNKNIKDSVDLKLENPLKISSAIDELISKDPTNVISANMKKLSFVPDKKFENAIASCSKLLISEDIHNEDRTIEMPSKYVQCSSLFTANAVIYHALKYYKVKSSGNETRITVREQSLLDIEHQIDTVFMNPEHQTTELVIDLGSIQIDDKVLDPLLNLIWQFKLVNKVSLSIRNGSFTKTNIKRIFSGGIEIFQGLKILELDLRRSTLLQERVCQREIETAFIDALFSRIEEFEELWHLTIKFDFLDKLTRDLSKMEKREQVGNNLISSMLYQAQSLIRLTSIELSFEGFSMPEEKLKHLGALLGKLPYLKSVNLNLSQCEKVNDAGTLELFKALSQMKVADLKLNLNGLKEISDSTPINYFKLIEKFKEIQGIHLSLDGCVLMSNNVLIYLASLISKNPRFHSIDFSFDGCKLIDNKGFSELSKTLQKLKGLKNLRLNCGKNDNINWKGGLACLYESISNLSQLESLILEMAKLKEMNNHCFINLIDSQEKNPNLNFIKLDFSQNPLISDFGIEMLIASIDCLQSLKSIELNLDNCSSLTIKSLQNILLGFSVLKKLNSLSITFSGISDDNNELENIDKVLSNYSALKNLSLRLPSCINYNDHIRERVCKTLEMKILIE